MANTCICRNCESVVGVIDGVIETHLGKATWRPASAEAPEGYYHGVCTFSRLSVNDRTAAADGYAARTETVGNGS